MGDRAADVVAPLVFLALVVASWALRPASRKLVVLKASPQETEGRPILNLGEPSFG